MTSLFGDGDFAAPEIGEIVGERMVVIGVGAGVDDELGCAWSVGSSLGVEAALDSDSSTSSAIVLAFFFLLFLGFVGFRNDTNPHFVCDVMMCGILSGS